MACTGLLCGAGPSIMVSLVKSEIGLLKNLSHLAVRRDDLVKLLNTCVVVSRIVFVLTSKIHLNGTICRKLGLNIHVDVSAQLVQVKWLWGKHRLELWLHLCFSFMTEALDFEELSILDTAISRLFRAVT